MVNSRSTATKGKKKWAARWWLGEKEKPGKQGILVRQRVTGPKAEEIARKLQERDYEKLEIGTFNKLKRVKARGERGERTRDIEDVIFNHQASIKGEERAIEVIRETLEEIKNTDPMYYKVALPRKKLQIQEREGRIKELKREIRRLERESERSW